MSETRPSPALRFLPSMTDVAFIMPLVFLFARLSGTRHLLADGDTGWHIRAGQWMLEHGQVVHRDVFSFTKPGEPWFAWEWLWDVTFAWLHGRFGMEAVLIASTSVIALTFALVFRLVTRLCPNPFLAIAVTIMATAGSAMHWLARPHLFTMLFVAVFLLVLERARAGNNRVLFLLPLLTVVWTNVHGGFFVGIILTGCYAAGEIAAWILEPERAARGSALSRGKPYLLTALGCAAASLLNPYTYHLHVHMYRFLSGSFHLQHIDEYKSTSFQGVLALWYEPMVLLGVVAAAWSVYRKRYAHVFLVAGWAHLGLLSVRNMPIYLIVAAPVVGLMLFEFVERLPRASVAGWAQRAAKNFAEYAADFGSLDRQPRFHLASALALLLVSAVLYAPAPPDKFRAGYDTRKYPAGALELLKNQRESGNIFTHDEWGDYLIFTLYPEGRVFVDGRADFYGEKFLEKYLEVLDVKYGWEDTLKKYRIGAVVLPVDAPLAGALKESTGWRPVFDDGIAIVFRPSVVPVPTSPAGRERPSVVACDDRNSRGRATTKSHNSDPWITKTNTTRSEPL